MANTFPIIDTANTFGDWVIRTNSLVLENNDFAANTYVKDSGTLHLNDDTLGLNVSSNVIIQRDLFVYGTIYANNIPKDGGNTIAGNTITINANNTVANISYIVVNRGLTGSNAEIRWNESNTYWDIKNVGTNTYTEILTSNNPLTDVEFRSIGVGVNPSGNVGEVRAVGSIIASFSDDRLKNKLYNIENALDKVKQLSGFYYEANELAQELGYEKKREIGVSYQDCLKVVPEVTADAPIDPKYGTVRYEKIVPLLIEAIKEIDEKLEDIKKTL